MSATKRNVVLCGLFVILLISESYRVVALAKKSVYSKNHNLNWNAIRVKGLFTKLGRVPTTTTPCLVQACPAGYEFDLESCGCVECELPDGVIDEPCTFVDGANEEIRYPSSYGDDKYWTISDVCMFDEHTCPTRLQFDRVVCECVLPKANQPKKKPFLVVDTDSNDFRSPEFEKPKPKQSQFFNMFNLEKHHMGRE